MNTFVVGSTGFLGYFAVRELLARGHNVRSISLHPAPPENLGKGHWLELARAGRRQRRLDQPRERLAVAGVHGLDLVGLVLRVAKAQRTPVDVEQTRKEFRTG